MTNGQTGLLNKEDQPKSSKKKYIIIGVVVGIAVLALVLGLTLGKSGDDPSPPSPPSPGGTGYNPYKVSGTEQITGSGQAVTGVIKANPEQVKKDFANYNTNKFVDGLIKNLRGAGYGDQEKVSVVEPQTILEGVNNDIISEIAFEIGQADYKTAYVSLSDARNSRYSPPEDLVGKKSSNQNMRLDMCGLTYSTKDTFDFTFTSTRDGSELVSSKGGNFLMLDKYIQLDLTLPSQRIYGLGERTREFDLQEGTWTMWANGGQNSTHDNGSGGQQTYGVHPFALIQTKEKNEFMGIFFRNSNAQSPVLSFNDNGGSTLSYITTGGNLEMFFFFKGTAKEVIANYQNLIGYPSLPPFWALGWHAASGDYKNMTILQENIQGYADAGVPLEGVWLTNSYMSDSTDFTVNGTAFPNLGDYTKELQKQNKRLILVIDAGLSADDTDNQYFQDALSTGSLIMSSIDDSSESFGGVLVSHVYANKTVFLDFFSDKAADIWNQGLKALHDQVPFDGLWLDVNEATTFCNGECPDYSQQNVTQSAKRQLSQAMRGQVKFMVADDDEGFTSHGWYLSATNQTDNSTYFLPFIPGKFNLDNMSMSLNATHPANNETEYNVHSLFGHMESKVTREFLLNDTMGPNPKNRTFTLSRSTFPGSGVHTQHWLGENQRSWEHLTYSIAGVMNFNMFGIPMVGPDTCGYMSTNVTGTQTKEEEEELCTEWIRTATFYPFARQNMMSGNDLEPWKMSDSAKTKAKAAILDRYQYLRHMYTCLAEASMSGKTCFDPLLFHYPEDDQVFTNIEHTFLVGDALKVSPQQTPANTSSTINSYFPAGGDWVSMQNYSDIVKLDNSSKGQWVELDPSLPTVNVHLRPGYMVPKQTFEAGKVNSTEDLLATPLSLIVNRDMNGHAQGKLFLDDGYTLDQLSSGNYASYDFQLGGKTLKKWIENWNLDYTQEGGLESVVITNAEDLKTTDFACMMPMASRTPTTLTPTYDPETMTLTIKNPSGSIDLKDMRDIHFGFTGEDLNLCNPETHFYRWNETLPYSTLDTNKAEILMTSQTPGVMRDLKVTLSVLESGVINIHYTYDNKTGLSKEPFEVPTIIVDAQKEKLSQTKKLSDNVAVSEGEETGAALLMVKNDAGDVVFTFNGMFMQEYINYMDVTVNTDKTFRTGIIGLTERVSNDLYLETGVYSLWSRDTADPVETGKAPGNNMYGTHPFYMGKATNGWFGVFANNAAAQDWWITNDKETGDVNLKTIATGGTGDLYIMTADTPNAVTKLYHTIIGTPVLVPQWALGWNQCRWGYNSTEELEAVVGNYSASGLPLDTQWSDIDYLKDYRDFTYDMDGSFKGLPDFVNGLHDKNMHWIPIMDAGVAVRNNPQQDGKEYVAFKDGVAEEIFIKDQAGDVMLGQVWPVDAAFPDYFNSKTQDWWSKWLSNFHNQVPFDGLWEDMNEASNFCNGVCYKSQLASSPVKNLLPYVPTMRNLETKSLPLDSVHTDNQEMMTQDVTELDAHSLFGTMEAQATHQWFKSQNKRTMIIERSAYAGMGKFASRWLGDNFSNQDYMGYSITGVMAHNIMGIPLAGSDICGFIGDTTDELCARWHVVGSFYPFSRNHNAWDSMPQEPYTFTNFYESNVQYLDIMKMAILNKYNMIRYYYTELSMLSQDGGAFYKPLFFEFPEDPNTTLDQVNNIMLGDALKLGINANKLDQNKTMFYFPAGTWCNIVVETEACVTYEQGQEVELDSKAYDFYLHLREGYIVPMQDAKALNAMTSADLQKQPVDFHVSPTANTTHFVAMGRYLNDDGVVLNVTGYQNVYGITYESVKTDVGSTMFFERSANASMVESDHPEVVNANDELSTIKFHNAKATMNSQNMKVSAVFKNDTATPVPLTVATYDETLDILTFKQSATEGVIYLPDLVSLTMTPAA